MALHIPDWIMEMNNITILEKCLLAQISFFNNSNGCHASNAHLAKLFGVSEPTIMRAISKLKVLKYIKHDGYYGKFRRLITLVNKTSQIDTLVNMASVPSQIDQGVSVDTSQIDQQKVKKKVKKKSIALVSDSDKGLKTWLREGFLKLNDGHFSNYQKEAIAIQQLIKKAKNVSGGRDIQDFLRGMIQKFVAKKKSSRGEYWKDAPLLPSALNQRWDQVYAVANSEAVGIDELKNNPILQGFLERG